MSRAQKKASASTGVWQPSKPRKRRQGPAGALRAPVPAAFGSGMSNSKFPVQRWQKSSRESFWIPTAGSATTTAFLFTL